MIFQHHPSTTGGIRLSDCGHQGWLKWPLRNHLLKQSLWADSLAHCSTTGMQSIAESHSYWWLFYAGVAFEAILMFPSEIKKLRTLSIVSSTEVLQLITLVLVNRKKNKQKGKTTIKPHVKPWKMFCMISLTTTLWLYSFIQSLHRHHSVKDH